MMTSGMHRRPFEGRHLVYRGRVAVHFSCLLSTMVQFIIIISMPPRIDIIDYNVFPVF